MSYTCAAYGIVLEQQPQSWFYLFGYWHHWIDVSGIGVYPWDPKQIPKLLIKEPTSSSCDIVWTLAYLQKDRKIGTGLGKSASDNKIIITIFFAFLHANYSHMSNSLLFSLYTDFQTLIK